MAQLNEVILYLSALPLHYKLAIIASCLYPLCIVFKHVCYAGKTILQWTKGE